MNTKLPHTFLVQGSYYNLLQGGILPSNYLDAFLALRSIISCATGVAMKIDE